ncbi:MAG: arsenic resistance protein [Micromonosporaceae bacterium]
MSRLSPLDRFLPVWIGAAMAAGLLLGRLVPGLNSALNKVAIHGTSLPIALGLLLMMYPVLAKVCYTEIGRITADRRMMTASLLLNWVIGPAVMFALAWLLLPDQPAYRTGVILVGLARCIAMALIWNDLAGGDREMATVLVALNAVFQVLLYAALGFFYLQVLPGWLGLQTTSLHVSIAEIAGTVAIMWFGGFMVSRRLHLSYPRTAALSFSAASNDFELAIAVAIGVFGVTSGQALAGVVGPLIEVPVMVALVYVALWARRRFYPAEEAT